MEIDFENEYLADIYQGLKIRGKPKYQQDVINKFTKTVNILKSLSRIENLFQLNSLNYEKLSGNKKELSSVRITKQYRLEFQELLNTENVVYKILITDLTNHYK